MSNFTYDSPLRTTHRRSGTPTEALTMLIPVPYGVDRMRLRHVGAVLSAGSSDSTNAIEVGIAGDADAFYSGISLAVTAAAPADVHTKDLSAVTLDNAAAVLVTIGADAGATGDTVDFDFVLEWF